MSDFDHSEIEDLKLHYYDVINGACYFPERKIYIKHFNEIDNIKSLIYKKKIIKDYEKQGLLSTKNKKKYLIENDLWTQEKEDRILQLKYIISDNEKQIESFVVPSQKANIQSLVNRDKEELDKLQKELDGLLEPTSESMSLRESENYLIFISCFEDEKLTKPYWTEPQFDQLSESLLIDYKVLFRATLYNTSLKIIEKIACMPFYLNALRLADKKIENFFDKKAYEFTYAQSDLYLLGVRNLNILNNTEGTPPSLIDSTAEDLVKWYDLQYSIMLSKSKN